MSQNEGLYYNTIHRWMASWCGWVRRQLTSQRVSPFFMWALSTCTWWDITICTNMIQYGGIFTNIDDIIPGWTWWWDVMRFPDTTDVHWKHLASALFADPHDWVPSPSVWQRHLLHGLHDMKAGIVTHLTWRFPAFHRGTPIAGEFISCFFSENKMDDKLGVPPL